MLLILLFIPTLANVRKKLSPSIRAIISLIVYLTQIVKMVRYDVIPPLPKMSFKMNFVSSANLVSGETAAQL
jgi:hypothetical protein